MEEKKYTKELELSIKDLLQKFPWLSYVALKTNYIEKPTIYLTSKHYKMAAFTDGKNIILFKMFYEQNRDVRLRILLHELLHVILEHVNRARNKKVRKWNFATDLVVWLCISQLFNEEFQWMGLIDGKIVPIEKLSDMFFKKQVKIDELKNMSAEEIYEILKDFPEDEFPTTPSNELQKSDVHPSGEESEEDKELSTTPSYDNVSSPFNQEETKEIEETTLDEFASELTRKTFKIDAHDIWYKMNENSVKEVEETATEAQASIKIRNFGENKIGDVPGQIIRLIDGLTKVKFNWRYLLREVVTDMLKGTYTWIPPNPRYLNIVKDIFLPRYKYTWGGFSVGIAVDTSGSMEETELAKSISFLYDLLCQYDVKIKIVVCDCEVKSDVTYFSRKTKKDEIIKEILKNLKGGGGTSFVPAINKFVEDTKKRKWTGKIVFYFTDGDGVYPEGKNIPFTVVWCLTDGDRKVPFGKKIILEKEDVA